MQEHPHIDDFNETVWKIVRQVPQGKVSTYGQLASMIPCPPELDAEAYQKLAPRWVGKAMNAVSSVDDKTIPWWRVINSKGGISMNPQAGGYIQKQRLMAEGVIFNAKEFVDFNAVGWRGPDAEFLEAHELLPPLKLGSPKDDNLPQQLRLF